ncbi:MAG: AAA family ATPase [Planctomycetota bacterium]|nr:AAA family ATPase [Planctomycetota bacterium]
MTRVALLIQLQESVIMKIERLEIKDMWSFRKEGGLIEDFETTNLIIGKNNSGKSNVLKAIRWVEQNTEWFKKRQGKPGTRHGELHLYAGEGKSSPTIAMGISYTETEIQELLAPVGIESYPESLRESIRQAFTNGIELRYQEDLQSTQRAAVSMVVRGFGLIDKLPMNLKGPERSDVHNKQWESAAPELRSRVCELLSGKIDYLGGWRTLRHNTREGKPAVDALRDWMHAPAAEDHLHQRFNRFEEFFATVTGMHGAAVRFEGASSNLMISWRNRTLDMDSFGDGIQHLLLLAFEFLQREDNVFLIEEPETHLHPIMQRQIWDFAQRESGSQFIVTTHSNVLLDANIADRVFHVTYDEKKSEIRPAFSWPELRDILDDIGARPSDLLQSNVVIWVEGPTDRMFFDKCIQLAQQNADENEMTVTRGLHYEIVLYGGSTGSYLTLCDGCEEDEHREKMENLINLMNLCRNVVFICDSDKSSADKPITPWKERIRKECEEGDNKKRAVFWTTEGREIENYIPDRVLTNVYRELLAVDTLKVTLGKYQDIHNVVAALQSKAPEAHKWKTDYDDNKARHMKALVPKMTEGDLKQHGLRTSLEKVVAFIRNANSR